MFSRNEELRKLSKLYAKLTFLCLCNNKLMFIFDDGSNNDKFKQRSSVPFLNPNIRGNMENDGTKIKAMRPELKATCHSSS